jgi:hypothetical protein
MAVHALELVAKSMLFSGAQFQPVTIQSQSAPTDLGTLKRFSHLDRRMLRTSRSDSRLSLPAEKSKAPLADKPASLSAQRRQSCVRLVGGTAGLQAEAPYRGGYDRCY